MKNFLYAGILVSLLAACTSSSEQSKTNDSSAKSEKLNEKELVAVIPNRTLTLQVDGMVCEMGCGGTIRKELKGTGGVARCSFDFKGENVPSTATIEFDKDKISADRIAKIIEELNDGQFSVGNLSTETIAVEAPKSAEEKESTSKTSPQVQMSESSGFQLPNFLGLLSDLLIH